MSWAAEEFRGIDLGDKRLDRRAVLFVERLAAKSAKSIPTACNGWAETQAAYRFLSNKRVGWEAAVPGELHRDPAVRRARMTRAAALR